MKHARQDYNRIQDPTGKIPANEPVFLLRGQDVCAPYAIQTWADEAEKCGADPEMIAKARAWAAEMFTYQADIKCKMPDQPKYQVPDGEPLAIHDLNDINTETLEGRLLMAALAKITTESQRDKTPWQLIEQLNELKRHMYDEARTAQEAWDALIAKTRVEQQGKELDGKAESTGVQCGYCGTELKPDQPCPQCFPNYNS